MNRLQQRQNFSDQKSAIEAEYQRNIILHKSLGVFRETRSSLKDLRDSSMELATYNYDLDRFETRNKYPDLEDETKEFNIAQIERMTAAREDCLLRISELKTTVAMES